MTSNLHIIREDQAGQDCPILNSLNLCETVYDYLERRDHSLVSMPKERTLSHLNEYDFFSKLSSQLTSQAHTESQG